MSDRDDAPASESTTSALPGRRPIRLWILQRELHHYRIPVWDEFVARHGSRFELTVLGALQNGKPFGSSTRPDYVRELPASEKRNAWTQIPLMLKNEQPDVLVTELNPRYGLCWRLPGLCKKQQTALVGWSKVTGTTRGPLRLPFELAKRRLFRAYPALLVYGESSRAELLDHGIDPSDIFVSRNTIDTRRIFTDADAIAARATELRRQHALEDANLLVMVARMDPAKRHSDLIAAWPALRAADERLRLVLVGGGSDLERIQREAAAIDSERIVVTGRVPEGDDYAWIAAADYNIQPGAVGLAINQSMALGTPTLIADEPGPDAENIQHEKTGWRFRRGDPEDLVRKFRQIQSDPERTQEIASRARELIRNEVNIEHMVESMLGSIERSLAKSKFRGEK